jgi:hypothetical protein
MLTLRKYAEMAMIMALIIAGVAWLSSIDPRHAKGQSTALGPNGTSVPLNAGTPVQIIGANPTRHSLQFCNPSAIVEFIAPVGPIVLSTAGVGIGLPAIASGVTSCFTVPLGVSTIGAAWNGSSASATPNITVLEYP